MSDVKDIAFNRGMAMLKASGAVYVVAYGLYIYRSENVRYALETSEGIVGNLEVVKATKRRAPNGPRRDWKYTGYLEGVKNLKPGDNWTYTATSREEVHGLQKAASGRAAQYHGPGSCLSSVDYTTLKFEILRVE